MAGSTFDPLFRVFDKLQNVLSSSASSSCPPVVPELKQLNEMVYEVYSPLPEEKPTLEILFFHGLQLRHSNEAHFTTWLSNDNSHLWLQTWLVEAFPTARILIISYDASLTSTNEVGNLDMYCTSENLVSSLIGNRVRVGEVGCPVVLVGHCLGGLVLKQVCLSAAYMSSRNTDDSLGVGRVNDLLLNMRGMFFYGTPHVGSLLGDELPEKMKSALVEEMETLKASSAQRNQEFHQLKSRYLWVTSGVGEQDETFLEFLGKSIHVVPEASARQYMDSYCSVRGDHFNICKPSRKSANAFCLLADFLQKIQEDGPVLVLDSVDSCQAYYVDLEGRAVQATKILAQPGVHTIFILGLSGLGKSALAQQVFNNIRRNFEVACFVSLDTTVEASNCKEQIWQKIQDSLKGVDVRSIHSHFSLPDYLKRKKVLMVLDNVQSEDQLRALQTRTWLEGTSIKLIVTTKTSRLGPSSSTSMTRFEVPYLNNEESIQLFSKYAFENGQVPLDSISLIAGVIQRCANFPLSLKILGGYASKEDVHNPRLWQELIERMDEAVDVDSGPNYRLWATFRICFEALGSTEQELFLDVATLFHGFPFSMVECIWDGCWKFPFTAWNNLKKRFLANEDKEGKIWMHSQLRVLGQNIACDQTTTLDKWKRVYRTKNARELIAKHQGVVAAKGLNLQNQQHERVFLTKTTFVAYIQLRYLMLEGVEITGENVELPTSLVYLRWTNSLFEIFPVDFTRLKKLAVLDLTNCRALKTLPPGLKNARSLTWLELAGCVSLENPFGILSKFRHLKYLGLSSTGVLASTETQMTRGLKRVCGLEMLMSLDLSRTAVRALPESISTLRLLTTLNVERTKLRSLPESIGELLGLETLNLSYTHPLKSLPESIGKLRNLRICRFVDTNVSRLPDTIGDLLELEVLAMDGSKVREVPKTFSKLLRLKFYQGTATFHDNSLQHLGSLESLRHLVLDLRDVGEESPPAMIDGQLQVGIYSLLSPLFSLHALTDLALYGTDYAQSLLPQLFCALQKIPCLQTLSLKDFKVVEIMPLELGTLTNLKHLGISKWPLLKELPKSLGNLSITYLRLQTLPRLSRLPESLVGLSSLSELVIRACESLQSMPSSFGHMSSFQPECSTEQRNKSATPNPSDHPAPSQLRRFRLTTNSWRLLECFLECCRGQSVNFRVNCDVMKKVMKKVTRDGEGAEYDVLDTKVAVELFREMEFNRPGEDNGLPEGSGATTAHPPWRHCPKFQLVWIRCAGETISTHRTELCNVHGKGLRVMDTQEESDKDTEGKEDETDSETGAIKRIARWAKTKLIMKMCRR